MISSKNCDTKKNLWGSVVKTITNYTINTTLLIVSAQQDCKVVFNRSSSAGCDASRDAAVAAIAGTDARQGSASANTTSS